MRAIFVCVQLLEEEYVYARLTRLRKHRGKFAAFGAVDVVRRDSDRSLTWISEGGVKGEPGVRRLGRVARRGLLRTVWRVGPPRTLDSGWRNRHVGPFRQTDRLPQSFCEDGGGSESIVHLLSIHAPGISCERLQRTPRLLRRQRPCVKRAHGLGGALLSAS